jgi:dTDP-4-amino-4,6-dideoxygalactose transaminase
MSTVRIPFLDLQGLHRDLEGEILEAILPLLREAAFVGGEPVAAFERDFAALHGNVHAVTVKSGTAALELGLRALGIGPGDEVLVPAFTFVATAAAVAHVGAVPVFVDVDDDTATIDPDGVRRALTPATRGMIPVHLYGHPAPMESLLPLARERGLRVLEDCAQSHLAVLDGRPVGTFGDAAAYSFYPTKNLGAAGDAGCVLTPDRETADRVRRYANHGRTEHALHAEPGWNERLDAIQAAILGVKLRRLARWTEARREAADRYREFLAGAAPFGEPLRLPEERPGALSVYHLYVVRHPRRDEIARALAGEGIGTAIHYPLAVPDQPAFRDPERRPEGFPRAASWARTCLALPLHPGISARDQERVAEAIRRLPG